jgi:hypothetical protein
VFARYNELSCETSSSVKAPDAAEGAGEQRQPESFRSEGSDREHRGRRDALGLSRQRQSADAPGTRHQSRAPEGGYRLDLGARPA